MEKHEMIWIATKYVAKSYTYEQMKYGDDLYGREEFAEQVGEYMDELYKIGHDAFYEKYKEYRLY